MKDQHASEIVHYLVEYGIQCAVLSSGSRSIPLAYALYREPRIKKVTHFDERGAAFYAYGYAKSSNTLVVVVVTSGTAVANLFPAIMEASLDHVPLLILTADRPPELQDCGANQTCDQVKVFGDYVRWFFEIPCFDEHLPEGMIRSTLAQAVYRAMNFPKGPVHLNCPLREPFVLPQTGSSFPPPTLYETVSITPSESSIMRWAKTLSASKKGVILVGKGGENCPSFAYTLAEKLNWPILADISSRLRTYGRHSHVIRYYPDLIKLFSHSFLPDCVLHLGGRSLMDPWLNRIQPDKYMVVTEHPYRFDPTHKGTHRVQCDPFVLCQLLLPFIKSSSTKLNWLNLWQESSKWFERGLDSWIPLESEPGYVHYLQRYLPNEMVTFFGNSMPIRDADRWFFPLDRKGPIFTKRGVSGIDGNIAMAAGLSEGGGASSHLLAIIGDLTALHDLNSLPLLKRAEVHLTLMIVNNQGGSIFSFLPHSNQQSFNKDFTALAHPWKFELLAQAFDLPYLCTSNPKNLITTLEKRETGIVEFKSDLENNHTIHKKIEAEITLARSSFDSNRIAELFSEGVEGFHLQNIVAALDQKS